MKTTTAGMRTHLDGTVTTLATIWKITRTDGVELFFTDHDVDLVFGGDTYDAESGYSRSAISSNSSLSVDNLEVEGLFSSAQITEEDLRAGRYNYAEVRISMVDWTDPDTNGEIKMRRGRFGEIVVTNQGVFRTELRGMTQQLSQQLLDTYSPECRVDLGSAKCGIPILPDVLPRNTAVDLGDFYRVSTSVIAFAISNALVNPDFELDALGTSVASLTGWTIVSGNWDLHDSSNNGLSPHAGSQYLEGGNTGSGEIRQDIDMEAILPQLSSIDAGNILIQFVGWRANSMVDDEGQIIIEYLDSAGAVLTTAYDSTSEEITPEDTWATRTFGLSALTSGTRTVRLRLLYTRITGGTTEAAFDDLSIGFVDSSLTPATTTQRQYGNRVYEVTVAGTTAGSQPSYNTAVDATTVDGTATLTSRDAFMRHAEVTGVTDRRTFTIQVDESRDVDDWFNFGAVTWETGTLTGFTTEIKDWDSRRRS